MTLASTGILRWPPQAVPDSIVSATLTDSSLLFDSKTDRIAYVGCSYLTDSISKIYIHTRVVTTGDTVEVRVESVTNGKPSGTLIDSATTNNAKGTIAIADTDDNSWKSVTLGAAASLTPGQLFAIVIVWSAESGGAGVSIGFGHCAGSASTPIIASGIYPTILQDTGGGTWAYASISHLQWVLEMTTAGVIAMPGLSPQSGPGTITAFNNTTNPNERGAKFVPPVKMRVIGICAAMFNLAAGADFTFSLWDSTDNPGASPTPLAQTSSMDGDFPVATTSDGNVSLFFPTPVTLNAGTTYYMGIKPDTANNIGVGELPAGGTGAAANGIRAFGLGSITFHLATRQWSGNDPGAWTLTTTTLPIMSLIVDQLDDGAGAGGGLLTHPGMAGGMRG